MFLLGVVFYGIPVRFGIDATSRNYRDRRRLGVRWPVNWQQRTPHPPNDWI
jgi:hypothetical protein